jgi:hypothetical protein
MTWIWKGGVEGWPQKAQKAQKGPIQFTGDNRENRGGGSRLSVPQFSPVKLSGAGFALSVPFVAIVLGLSV